MIIFENQGAIDVDAIVTFGVSVKIGENPIGFFGTGLKYAIAVLLREGHSVTIFSGERELRFVTERVNVRGQDFDFVLMREGDKFTRAGFTTELGKKWQIWMAYRELYCNARDEGGSVYQVASVQSASDIHRDRTQIRVEGSGVEQVHRDAASYFCEDEPDLVVGGVGVYRRSSQVLFYRGVRVLFLPRPAAFTYNIIDQRLDLTEDRTMAHPFLATWYLAGAMAKCEDKTILLELLAPVRGVLENSFDYAEHDATSTQFLETVTELKKTGARVTPRALAVWEREVPDQFVLDEAHLTYEQKATLNQATRVCKRIGIPGDPVPVVATPANAPTFVRDGRVHVLRSRIRDADVDALVADLIRGHMDKENMETEARENYIIRRLVAVAVS